MVLPKNVQMDPSKSLGTSAAYARFRRRSAGRGNYDYTGSFNPFRMLGNALGSFSTADMQIRNNIRMGLANGMVKAENDRLRSETLGQQDISNFDAMQRKHTELLQETHEDGTPVHDMPGPLISWTPGGKMGWSGTGNVRAAKIKSDRESAKRLANQNPEARRESTLSEDLGGDVDATKPITTTGIGKHIGETAGGALAGLLGVETGPADAAVATAGAELGGKLGDAAEKQIIRKVRTPKAPQSVTPPATPTTGEIKDPTKEMPVYEDPDKTTVIPKIK